MGRGTQAPPPRMSTRGLIEGLIGVVTGWVGDCAGRARRRRGTQRPCIVVAGPGPVVRTLCGDGRCRCNRRHEVSTLIMSTGTVG